MPAGTKEPQKVYRAWTNNDIRGYVKQPMPRLANLWHDAFTDVPILSRPTYVAVEIVYDYHKYKIMLQVNISFTQTRREVTGCLKHVS
jgi:hypothetical protein